MTSFSDPGAEQAMLAHRAALEEIKQAPPTYEQALAAPTGKGGRGWKYADETSSLAAAAQALQYLHPGISPKLVFEGARKRGLAALELLALGDDPDALDALMWE